MEIVDTAPNTEANFNMKDKTMRRVIAIPDLLMELTVRSCKLSSLAFAAHSLVSLACQLNTRGNTLT
ncbi:hypothetical protein Pyn_40277 [Prunus yedoensis var. nudiflora]|uniref:Uncharacterized protein n=1 Tax=Prunus yedoensis var. nudiflora TaxID=2094558 RepID=A0A314YUM1_PRUYE|nr:hypothetical protein Pyn_40277 [Prunus yedoensis var. nudiflora]